MQLQRFMQDKNREQALWVSSQIALIRENLDDTVSCPWAETTNHPTLSTQETDDGAPPCQRCPFYEGHERASQGTDGQTPWVGVMCRYDGSRD